MPLIQCIPGSTETTVNGQNYAFQYDRFGRAVAQVYDAEAVKCFLAVQHYTEVKDVPDPEAPASEDLGQARPSAVEQLAVVEAMTVPAVAEPVAVDGDIDVDHDDAPLAEPAEPDTVEAAKVEPAARAAPAAKKKGGRPSKKSLAGE